MLILFLSSVPFAFVVLKENAAQNQEAVIEELKRLVATKIAKYAVPDHFLVRSHISPGLPESVFKGNISDVITHGPVAQVVKRLPKTRSGKIMRRILRKVSMEQTDIGDVSTLEDPNVVTEIIQAHKHYRSRSAKA